MATKTEFWNAPEAKALAEEKCLQWHPDLRDVRIEYVFCSDVEVIRGKDCLASARKVGGLNAFLASEQNEAFELVSPDGQTPEEFFCIRIWSEGWKQLTDAQRIALLDHELCHCYTFEDKDGNQRLGIAPHDLEEFKAVVERHGFWMPDVKEFADTCAEASRVVRGQTLKETVDAVSHTKATIRTVNPVTGEVVEGSMDDPAVMQKVGEAVAEGIRSPRRRPNAPAAAG